MFERQQEEQVRKERRARLEKERWTRREMEIKQRLRVEETERKLGENLIMKDAVGSTRKIVISI